MKNIKKHIDTIILVVFVIILNINMLLKLMSIKDPQIGNIYAHLIGLGVAMILVILFTEQRANNKSSISQNN